MKDLKSSLNEWVAAGLIDKNQAQAIRSHEATRSSGNRVPLIAEALGYVGGVLALVAIIILVAESWEDIGTPAKLTLVGVVAVVFLVVGAYFKRISNDAAGRLSSFLWALATFAAALWSGLFAALVLEVPDDVVPLSASLVGLGVALILYVLSRTSLQQVVFAGAIGASVLSASIYFDQDIEGSGAIVWGIGLVWLFLAWRERLPPGTTAYVVGSLILLAGPLVSMENAWWAPILGVLSAVGLVVLGVALRRVILLGLGGFGIFVYVPTAVFNYFGDAINPAVGLLISSAVLLIAALVVARLRSEVLSEE
jgi:uncharacterized membrane protein